MWSSDQLCGVTCGSQNMASAFPHKLKCFEVEGYLKSHKHLYSLLFVLLRLTLILSQDNA